MNILFMSLINFDTLKDRNIYTDLLREFVNNGHQVYVISPVEKRNHRKCELLQEKNTRILKLVIGNIQKTNMLEKGISTLTLAPVISAGIKKYFNNVKFDLILYPTPPITFLNAVAYVKKRDKAMCYLLLKDIFPQNAVDIGILSKKGVKGLIYKYFRWKEKKLYQLSDRIGCMSQANADYVLKHNPEIASEKVEICPNSAEPITCEILEEEKLETRNKYLLPDDKVIFVYGGNLGKPQGVDFIMRCFKACRRMEEIFFLIIGAGTEFERLGAYIDESHFENVKLLKQVGQEEYNKIVSVAHAGLIFLDHRFTIPNFPSRLLSYMQHKKAIIAATDCNTDLKDIIEKYELGIWCESRDENEFVKGIEKLLKEKRLGQYGENAYQYFLEHYTVKDAYQVIERSL